MVGRLDRILCKANAPNKFLGYLFCRLIFLCLVCVGGGVSASEMELRRRILYVIYLFHLFSLVIYLSLLSSLARTNHHIECTFSFIYDSMVRRSRRNREQTTSKMLNEVKGNKEYMRRNEFVQIKREYSRPMRN
jgi:hypothetical protein